VAGAHGRNAEEFIYRVKDGGDTPMEAMTSGMSVAAESLGMASQIGSVGEGMQADLVAVQGNPVGRHHRRAPRRFRHERWQSLQILSAEITYVRASGVNEIFAVRVDRRACAAE
jgi:hypothetical protein